MTPEATEEMGRYIWKIILAGGPVSMSWGIDTRTLRLIENGISFHVQGLKFTGIIEIVYDEGSDYFNINLVADEDTTKHETLQGIAFDELVRVIDEMVEYTGADYIERIKREYKIS